MSCVSRQKEIIEQGFCGGPEQLDQVVVVRSWGWSFKNPVMREMARMLSWVWIQTKLVQAAAKQRDLKEKCFSLAAAVGLNQLELPKTLPWCCA